MNKKLLKLAFAGLVIALSGTQVKAQGIITTVAGGGSSGSAGVGGPATAASISVPAGVAGNSSGDIFVVFNNICRKIDGATGTLTDVSLAGSVLSASGVTTDAAGNVYISDRFHDIVIKVDMSTGSCSTHCGNGHQGSTGDGGSATGCTLLVPSGVAVDASGNTYVIDCGASKIRKVDATTGIITTFAGVGSSGFTGDGGAATAARLNRPSGIAIDAAGNVFISDEGNQRIRKIDVATGIITTVAGTGATGSTGDGGPATAAQFAGPAGLCFDVYGNLYVADKYNNKVRIIDNSGNINTYAGTGGSGFAGDGGMSNTARLCAPTSVWSDAYNNLYIGDGNNNRIRRVEAPSPLPRGLNNGNGLAGGINVVPNPSNGAFTLQADLNMLKKDFTICNSVGARVYSGTFNTQLQTIVLDQPAGMYFLTSGNTTKRLVITK